MIPIYEQDSVRGIKYGLFTSDYNGCGWIACYNVLFAFGMAIQPETVARELGQMLRMGGVFGTCNATIIRYLRSKGLAVGATTRGFDEAIKGAGCGILEYTTKRFRRHFVFVQEVENEIVNMGLCRYLNPTCKACTINDYLKKYALGGARLILIRR